MLLEDRSYNRLHNEKSMESIIMQTMHSSPHHVVHPTRSHPHAMKAFQATHGSSNLLNISGSPLLSTKSQVVRIFESDFYAFKKGVYLFLYVCELRTTVIQFNDEVQG